jgi:hypothetical protein
MEKPLSDQQPQFGNTLPSLPGTEDQPPSGSNVTPREGLGSERSASQPPPLSDQEWYNGLIASGVSPFFASAQLKHRRDLPELLSEHQDEWVAYKGDERLEIGRSKTALYRKYLDQGGARNELLVLCIEPDLFEDPPDFAPSI